MPPKSSKNSFLVCIPCFGKPYIWRDAVTANSEDEGKYVRQIVRGPCMRIPNKTKTTAIHPLFTYEDKRWKLINKLYKHKSTVAYQSEDGIYRGFSANMATIDFTDPDCPHLLGDIALIVPEKTFADLDISIDTLKLVPENWENGDFVPYEPYDDDEEDLKKQYCTENNLDYYPHTGQIYLQKID